MSDEESSLDCHQSIIKGGILIQSNPASNDIIMYSTRWCSDCFRAKWFFDNYGVSYTEVNIEKDPAAVETVLKLNGGKRSVPTILFPDGSILVEPTTRELAHKVGVQL